MPPCRRSSHSPRLSVSLLSHTRLSVSLLSRRVSAPWKALCTPLFVRRSAPASRVLRSHVALSRRAPCKRAPASRVSRCLSRRARGARGAAEAGASCGVEELRQPTPRLLAPPIVQRLFRGGAAPAAPAAEHWPLSSAAGAGFRKSSPRVLAPRPRPASSPPFDRRRKTRQA